MAIDIDDYSSTKPGAVPFKWEIKPGVPKLQQKQSPPPSPVTVLSPPQLPEPRHHPQKLRPPPSGSYFVPPPATRTRSFRASPRTRSERWRFDQHTALVRPDVVSPGCFLSSFLIRRKRVGKQRLQMPGPESEPDYTSNLETLARWSVSSRKSLSPLSSCSSYQSSPRPVSDAEWAGFGLF